MGCAASLPVEGGHAATTNDWYTPPPPPPPPPSQVSRSISMPAHAQYDQHEFHIVPLSSRKYGISMSGNNESSLHRDDDSMTEMLKALHNSFQMGPSTPNAGVSSKTWAEVSSILEDLKPGIETHIQQAAKMCPASTPDPKLSSSQSMPPVSRRQPSPSFKETEVSSKLSSKKATGRSRPSFLSRILKDSSGLKTILKRKSGEDLSHSPYTIEGEGSLFDADLLASYEEALKGLTQDEWDAVQGSQGMDTELDCRDSTANEETRSMEAIPHSRKAAEFSLKKDATLKVTHDPLDKYEKLCPSRGEAAVVLYTTSLRGVRKTFEDCNRVRSLLESFCISVDERDISMHQDFKNELKDLMGGGPTAVPRLFVKGRYIGGAEAVLQLHEEEQLLPLLESVPRNQGPARLCDGCGGARFVPCFECSGSRKVVNEGKQVFRCPHCNENGLIQCPLCC